MGIYYVSGVPYSTDYLMHFGIKGQKWGIRRYQNPDGTLTAEGKKRYGDRLGVYAKDIATSAWRRGVTGDSFGGLAKRRGKKEEILKNKRNKAYESGDTEKAKKLDEKYRAVKEANISLDAYYSHMSVGEIVSKRLLLRDGTDMMPRTSLELQKAFDTPKITRKVEQVLKYAPVSEEARLAILMYSKR